MPSNPLFNQFFQSFSRLLGSTGVFDSGTEALSSELHQKIRAAAQATFDKLDIVTRDEFDAQRAVLARTRERLEKLEQQLTQLENGSNN